MESKYTNLDTEEPLVAHSVKADLTPALGEPHSYTGSTVNFSNYSYHQRV